MTAWTSAPTNVACEGCAGTVQSADPYCPPGEDVLGGGCVPVPQCGPDQTLVTAEGSSAQECVTPDPPSEAPPPAPAPPPQPQAASAPAPCTASATSGCQFAQECNETVCTEVPTSTPVAVCQVACHSYDHPGRYFPLPGGGEVWVPQGASACAIVGPPSCGGGAGDGANGNGGGASFADLLAAVHGQPSLLDCVGACFGALGRPTVACDEFNQNECANGTVGPGDQPEPPTGYQGGEFAVPPDIAATFSQSDYGVNVTQPGDIWLRYTGSPAPASEQYFTRAVFNSPQEAQNALALAYGSNNGSYYTIYVPEAGISYAEGLAAPVGQFPGLGDQIWVQNPPASVYVAGPFPTGTPLPPNLPIAPPPSLGPS